MNLQLVGARVESELVSAESLKDLRIRMPATMDESAFFLEYLNYRNPIYQDRVESTKIWLSDLDISPDRVVVLLWSGGIDSTSLLGNLLLNQYIVIPVYLATRYGGYLIRELAAVKEIWQTIKKGGVGVTTEQFGENLSPPWYFDLAQLMNTHESQPDLVPDRNKLMVNFVIRNVMEPLGVFVLAAGEYTGAEHWVVDWHVPVEDCKPESFRTWVGPERKFLCLDDVATHVTVKSDRLEIGLAALGASVMSKTTCCLSDTMLDCGMCYCCVERAAAWDKLFVHDYTEYVTDPRKHWLYPCYMEQHDRVFKGR